jgi:hypothetical protein
MGNHYLNKLKLNHMKKNSDVTPREFAIEVYKDAIEKYSDNKEAFDFGLESIQRVIDVLKLTTSEDSLEFFKEAKEEFEGIFNIH